VYKQLFDISKNTYFFIPFVLVLIDLVFYVSIPFFLLYLFDRGESMSLVEDVRRYLDLNKSVFVFLVLLVLTLFRIGVIKASQHVFSSSLSVTYTNICSEFVAMVLRSQRENKIIDLSRIRKVLTAEVNNLFFGFVVPLSFSLAEGFLVFVVFCYAFYLFGLITLVVAIFLLVSLLAVMFVLRKKGLEVGRQRSQKEKQRLEYIELLIGSGFSIAVNNGGNWFGNRFGEVSKGFSSALGEQVVLPFYTKSLVDGFLLVAVVVSVVSVELEATEGEIAILIGMALRVIPSISRISGYFETIRMNGVGAHDVSQKLSEMKVSKQTYFESEVVMSILNDIEKAGVYIIKGPSGVGKTGAVKKWLPEISKQSSVAYLDQAGFMKNATFDDYINLVGVTDRESVLEGLADSSVPAHDLSNLSGGQQRYLQFIAVCEKNARYLVLDEPSVGLDGDLKKKMVDKVHLLAERSIVVMITHDDNFITSLVELGATLHEL
jgi:ABC-type lipoprotein export system ATPase subunit